MGSNFEPNGLSTHPSPDAALRDRQTRRRVLRGGLGAAMATLFGAHADANSSANMAARASAKAAAAAPTGKARALMGFTGIPVSITDDITVPPGYRVQVLYAWGDAIGHRDGAPPFAVDNSAQEQSLQAGMHHDGMHFFPFRKGNHGLLAVNHEYVDDGLLHAGGMTPWSAGKMQKSQAAHGIAVIEIKRASARAAWQVVRPSPYARRITATTPIRLSGPAAGDALLKTAFDPDGYTVLGTLNNCGHGYTPWGTYLSCEENWNAYFNGRASPLPGEARYGVRPNGFGYRWHEHDERFNVEMHPNEPHRFGWVVELDPFDLLSTPIKRTALGRIKHEGAFVTLTRDRRAVVYMGDDERFEYLYKFVSRDRVRAGGYKTNRDLLDHGTLYVARLDDDGNGAWLALIHGESGLSVDNGFASQADVLIRTRQAADQVGATRMDRPEWIAVHPVTGEVFATLTNNSERGKAGKPAVDRANPRSENVYGHIISWREAGDAGAVSFKWKQFLLAGDPDAAGTAARGTVPPGAGFGSPDGLWIDPRGLMWIQTDVSTSALGKGPYAALGNNQMLAADPASGEVRRFLTGPRGCEITGVVMSPDMRSMFVNIQHPGEPANERSDPARPTAISAWPRHPPCDRPRSATIVITREDGGIVGA